MALNHAMIVASIGAMFKPIEVTANPVVSGFAREDVELSTDAGSHGSPVSVSYQWQWADTGDDIVGATSATYTPVAADIGHTLRAKISATNGALVKHSYSDPTDAILPSFVGLAFTDVTNNRVYQRSTDTGGLFDKGVGSVTVPVTLSTDASLVEYRLVDDYNDQVVQGWTSVGTDIPQATTSITCPVPARLGWNRLELRANGDDTQVVSGANRFGMGRIIAACGQSQAVRQFTKMPAYTGTFASNGVTISPYGMMYATFSDGAHAVTTPSWLPPQDGTMYDSTFAGEILSRNIDLSGVNCAFIGHAVGSTPIATWIPGQSNNTNLCNVLDSAGGFEAMYWHQGGTDAGNGTSGDAYVTSLQSIMNDLGANHNAVRGTNFKVYLTTMATRTSGAAGTVAQTQDIRTKARAWALANNAVYVESHDIHLLDNVHQGQRGSARAASNLYRAMRPHFGLPGDHTGPIVTSATRALGSNEVVLTCSLPAGATQLVLSGAAHTRFQIYESGYAHTGVPLTYAASNQVSVSGNQITLRLASAPADSVALDIYIHNHPDPSMALAPTDMIYDDHLDGDGLTFGRQIMPSWGVGAIAAAPAGLSAPQNTVQPVVSGNPQAGQTLSVSNGTWSNSPTAFSYQWQRGGVDVSGATNQTYVCTAPDVGAYVRCVVTASNAAGSTPTNSDQTAPVSEPLAGLFAYDSFTDTDGSLLNAHVPDSGGTGWTAVAGGFTINAGRTRANVSTCTMSMTATPPSANYKVEAQLRVFTVISQSTYIAARIQDANTQIIGGYRNGTGWSFGAMVGGSYTQIGSQAVTLTPGDIYLLRLEVEGTTIRFYVNNALIGSGTSAAIANAGTPGFRNSGLAAGTATGLHWDNFAVAAI